MMNTNEKTYTPSKVPTKSEWEEQEGCCATSVTDEIDILLPTFIRQDPPSILISSATQTEVPHTQQVPMQNHRQPFIFQNQGQPVQFPNQPQPVQWQNERQMFQLQETPISPHNGKEEISRVYQENLEKLCQLQLELAKLQVESPVQTLTPQPSMYPAQTSMDINNYVGGMLVMDHVQPQGFPYQVTHFQQNHTVSNGSVAENLQPAIINSNVQDSNVSLTDSLLQSPYVLYDTQLLSPQGPVLFHMNLQNHQNHMHFANQSANSIFQFQSPVQTLPPQPYMYPAHTIMDGNIDFGGMPVMAQVQPQFDSASAEHRTNVPENARRLSEDIWPTEYGSSIEHCSNIDGSQLRLWK